MDTFFIKRGDTSPALRFILEPSDVVLTGASVTFQMRDRSRQVVLDRPGTVVMETGAPAVQHDWLPGDTDVAGLYEAEFRVSFSDGSVETFPNYGFIPVRISEDIA